MIERAFPTFWRERRRLAFVSILAFFAGFFFYARIDQEVMGLPIGLVTGASYAVIIVLVSLFICIVAPTMRFLIEAVAITRLMLALVAYSIPSIGEIVIHSPVLTAAIVVSSAAILSRTVLHGRMRRPQAESYLERFKLFFKRTPAHIEAPTPLQHRFVAWVDATEPVRV